MILKLGGRFPPIIMGLLVSVAVFAATPYASAPWIMILMALLGICAAFTLVCALILIAVGGYFD